MNTESPSVTASMASKRRQIKDKEIEIERKMRKLEETEHRNKQREKELKRKLQIRKQQERLEAAEKQLAQKTVDLKLKEDDTQRKLKEFELMKLAITEKEQEANAKLALAEEQRKKLKEREDHILMKFKNLEISKREMDEMNANFTKREKELSEMLVAIQAGEEERLQKEREIEEQAKVVATREQSIFDRLAVADEASISRREKEREVEQRCIDFDLKEQEINDRLAAIDAASIARRKKEQVIEEKMISFAMREQEIDDRLASLDAASVIARQKREVKKKEIEMEETLKLMELNEKELLIAEKNKALEEAMQLNMQREIEIKERMAALDAATTALMEKANRKTGQQQANQKPTLKEPKTNTEGVSYFGSITNTLYNVLQCKPSSDATIEPPENGDMSKSKGGSNFSVESGNLIVRESKPETNYPEAEVGTDMPSHSNGVRSPITLNAGAKQINQSLNGALKASYNLYDSDTGFAPPTTTTNHLPSTPAETVKFNEAKATDGNLDLPDRQCDENKKGGKKKKFKMFGRNRKK
jgi:hypothetical protein